MNEQSETPTGQQGPAASTAEATSFDASAPASSTSGAAALIEERPEVGVGAAFAGGFLLALILKRLAS